MMNRGGTRRTPSQNVEDRILETIRDTNKVSNHYLIHTLVLSSTSTASFQLQRFRRGGGLVR